MGVTSRGHRYRIAWGKQTSEGTPQTTPSIETSLYSGAIKPVRDDRPYEVSDTDDLPLGYWRSRAEGTGTIEIPSDPEVVGSLWAFHLGGNAIAGAGDPYTHTLTKAEAKPFLTVYQMRPDIVGGTDKWERLEDAFVKALEIRATAGSPLRHSAEFIAKSYQFNPASAPTPTKDLRIGATSTVDLSMIGATVKFDVDATPASTTIHTPESITIRSEYASAAWIQTDTLTPTYLSLGPYRVGATMTLVFDSFATYAATFLGTKTITTDMALSPTIVAGSLDVTFPASPTNANRNLQVQLPSLLWTAELPDVQPSGDAVRVTLTAAVRKAASGETITVKAKSARATVF